MTDTEKNKLIAEAIGERVCGWSLHVCGRCNGGGREQVVAGSAWDSVECSGCNGSGMAPADFASPELTLKLIEWAAKKDAVWWATLIQFGQEKRTALDWVQRELWLVLGGHNLEEIARRIRDIIYEALKGKGGGE